MARRWVFVRNGRVGAWLLALVHAAGAAEAECGASHLATFDVQGEGEQSPRLGETVTVEGVVTGDFRGLSGSFGELDGVFIEDPVGDESELTSDGLFVYWAAPLAVSEPPEAFRPGQRLRVVGRVSDYDTETQLHAEQVVVCGTDLVPVVRPLPFPVSGVRRHGAGAWSADLEAQEGMRVRIESSLRVVDAKELARHGEVTLVSGELPWLFTHANSPDVIAFEGYEQAIARRTLVIDDGSNQLFPNLSQTLRSSVAIGATWAGAVDAWVRAPRGDATGNRAAYRLIPRGEASWAPAPQAPGAPAPDHGHVRIVSANLHNLFKDGGDSGRCYPSAGSEDCRGLTSDSERINHLQETARSVAALQPDVVAAMEVQNDFGAPEATTWERWVDMLSAHAAEQGARCQSYRPALPGVYLGGDAIAVALAYCEESVVLEDLVWPDDELVAAWGAGTYRGANSSRLPLAGVFRTGDDRGRWTVVANHFKSRSPGSLSEVCPASGLADCDQGDGQGAWSFARTSAARALTDWLSDQSWRFGSSALLVGDFNCDANEEPLSLLREAGMQLLTTSSAGLPPSYAYDGRLSALDHALVSQGSMSFVSRVGVLDVNLGMPLETPPSSDHNPVYVDLSWDEPLACDCDAQGAIQGTVHDDVLWGTPGADVICGFGGGDLIFGLGGHDCISGGLGEDWVLTTGPRVAEAHIDSEHIDLDQTETPACVE